MYQLGAYDEKKNGEGKMGGVADKALVIAIEYPLFPLTKP